MIADDMMSFIKNDIIVFGIGVFIFIILTLWFIFRKFKMGNNAITWLCNISNYNDWFVRFNWMESNSNFIKFYCLNVILNMAMNIHLTVRFLQLKKEYPKFQKKKLFLKQVKK